MSTRINISSGAPWEPVVGYSRAVRVGQWVMVGGTTALDAGGNLVAPGDAYGQAVQCLRNIQAALGRAGAQMEHVVRTRIFLTSIADFDAVGRAHGEFFAHIRPVCTMVQVSRFVLPEMLVEIEADAVIPE